MRWILCLVLTASVVVSSAGSARAAEPGAERVIEIAVDATDLPDMRADLDLAVEAELHRLLAQEQEQEKLPAGVILADDRRLFVEIRPSPIPGTDDLLIHVEVQLEGELIGESMTETCLTCTTEEVAGMALMLLAPLLPGLPEPITEAPLAPAITATSDKQPAAEPESERSGRPLLITGAVLLGGGLVGVGVGAGLIAVDERVVSPFGAAQLEVIKYREPGVAIAVIGGAAALGGAVLLGLALGQRRRSRIAAAPVIGPGRVGVSLAGRF